ncbi:hypothetical protein N3698_002627 [Escherichia coli]|nr:hypothetical protein [Escherichia coli]
METVFDALKAMGKATSIELAARLDISREEVLNELWELKKAGFVDKSAYTWRVADDFEDVFEVDDGATPDEIQDEAKEIFFNYCNYSYHEIKDEEEEQNG